MMGEVLGNLLWVLGWVGLALGLVAWPTEVGKIIGAERLMAPKLGERFAQS